MTQIFNRYRNINRRIKNSLPDLFKSIEPRSLFEALEAPHDKSLGLPSDHLEIENIGPFHTHAQITEKYLIIRLPGLVLILGKPLQSFDTRMI